MSEQQRRVVAWVHDLDGRLHQRARRPRARHLAVRACPAGILGGYGILKDLARRVHGHRRPHQL